MIYLQKLATLVIISLYLKPFLIKQLHLQQEKWFVIYYV